MDRASKAENKGKKIVTQHLTLSQNVTDFKNSKYN